MALVFRYSVVGSDDAYLLDCLLFILHELGTGLTALDEGFFLADYYNSFASSSLQPFCSLRDRPDLYFIGQAVMPQVLDFDHFMISKVFADLFCRLSPFRGWHWTSLSARFCLEV